MQTFGDAGKFRLKDNLANSTASKFALNMNCIYYIITQNKIFTC